MLKSNLILSVFIVLVLGFAVCLAFPQIKQAWPEISAIQTKIQTKPMIKTKPADLIIKNGAVISLLPQSFEIKQGEEFKLSLETDTLDKEIAGLDVVLKYDKNLIEFQKAEPFLDLNLVFSKYNKDNLSFSLLVPVDKTVKGKVLAADLYFVAKASGQAVLSFIFDQDKVGDTQVVSVDGEDILAKAEDLLIKID